MSSSNKAAARRRTAPNLRTPTLNAFASFDQPAKAEVLNPLLLAQMKDSAAAPGVAVVDWRARGAIPTPSSQGNCNTCTSFAVVSVVESLHFLRTHARIQLAPGFIHQCLLNRDCDQGASAEEVLNAVTAHGIAFGFPNDYPFPTNQCATGNLFPVGRRAFLPGPNVAMEVLANQGPVVSDMLIDPAEFLKVGPETIYQFRASPDQRLHTVAVVGYDRNNGYWIIANSFGTKWGDGGFARVAFGSGGLLEDDGGWQIIL